MTSQIRSDFLHTHGTQTRLQFHDPVNEDKRSPVGQEIKGIGAGHAVVSV